MSKLLFVIEADPGIGQHQLKQAGDQLRGAIDRWSASGDDHLVIGFGGGMRLKVYQPDGEQLAEAPRIEVKYTSEER